MTRTFVILDLDGSVFPLPHRKVTPTPDRVTTTVAVPPRAPVTVTFRPAVVEAITRWAASADVQWLTSWGRKTQWLDQVGLPTLPVLYDPEPGEVFFWGRSRLSWKKPQVAELMGRQSAPFRVVWIDDDSFSPAYGDELRAAHPLLEDLLLIQPDCYEGLTDEDLLRVEKSLAG
ncbi:hypothetical protein [Pseudarthrobacter phenanthrenivorans]|uniref:Uncharacterized protein n=1 Tax=Pseudarthrobacter phenanthrenivorans TaxID=361575 RepID=A0A0B4EPQ4_PSEPS|nr:hypothetical protein [Pseudarthrobacter phenanthrenivorans]KIC68688.1 hypothetical protein RM50_04275 [Pseudarthrobacter phenanthrenivorans]